MINGIEQVEISDWLVEMQRDYLETGCFTYDGMKKLLGDPLKSVCPFRSEDYLDLGRYF